MKRQKPKLNKRYWILLITIALIGLYAVVAKIESEYAKNLRAEVFQKVREKNRDFDLGNLDRHIGSLQFCSEVVYVNQFYPYRTCWRIVGRSGRNPGEVADLYFRGIASRLRIGRMIFVDDANPDSWYYRNMGAGRNEVIFRYDFVTDESGRKWQLRE